MMGGAVYTHYSLKDSFERIAPSLVFCLLTICRLVILYQVNSKEKREMEIMRKMYEEMSAKGELNRAENDDDDVDVKKTR